MFKPTLRMRWYALLGCFAAWLPAGVAHGKATPDPPGHAVTEGLRREEERTRTLQQRLQPKADALRRAIAAPHSDALPAETPCFTIRRVALVGPDATRFNWLADHVAPFIGQCTGVTGLGQIAAAMDATLIELGYVTSRVGMPQQNLRDGTLTFSLHIGRVADMRLIAAGADRSPDDQWGTWRNAFPLSSGDILNARDLEQGVEQMKRLPSQSVTTEIEPGRDFNTSNVIILRQPSTLKQRTRGGITIDNSGSSLLGRTQLFGFLSFDNPLGLNDIATLTASSNAESPRADHRSQSLAFQYSIPWGYNTFSLRSSHSRFAQTVQGTSVAFLSHGRGESNEIRIDRTLLRTSASRFGAYAAVGTRRANSFLDDVELIVQRQRTTSFEVGVAWRHLAAAATLDFQLGYRRGMPWQDAQDDYPTAALGGLTLRPRITTLTGSIAVPFKLADRPLRYSGALRAQHTPDTTLSVDQIAIGGRFSVRGFDGDRVLMAENGYVVRNEVSTPVPLPDALHAVVFAGIDHGRVWGPSAVLLAGHSLAGAALGLRGHYKNLQFDLAAATPLRKPDGFQTRSRNLYLSLTSAF